MMHGQNHIKWVSGIKAQQAKSVHPYKTHRRKCSEPLLPSGLNHLTRKYIRITIIDIKLLI